MEWIELLLAGMVGLVISLSLIPVILRASSRLGLASRDAEAHHTHRTPVPRLGGIALAAALVVMAALFSILEPGFLTQHYRWLIIASPLAMFAMGLWDDLAALGARRKLFIQILIAGITFFCGLGINEFRVPFTNQVVHLDRKSVV